MRVPTLRAILLASLALLLALPAGAAGSTTAAQLLQQVQRNVAFVGKVAKDSGVRAEDRRVKPFLEEMRRLSLALDSLEFHASTRDPKAFEDLRQAGLAVAAARAAGAGSGVDQPAMTQALDKLDSAFIAYRSRFGREAALRRDGDQLSVAQAQELALLQEQNQKLVQRLGTLEAQVSSHRALAAEVRSLRQQAGWLSQRQSTPADYVGALLLAETLAGAWRGIYGWVSFCDPALIVVFQPCLDDWVVWNDLTVRSVNLVGWDSSDWNWHDAPVDVTWNQDYQVDLTEQEAAVYEDYVEQQGAGPGEEPGASETPGGPDQEPGASEVPGGPDASPDMTEPEPQDENAPSPDMSEPAPDQEPPEGMDEGPDPAPGEPDGGSEGE